MLNPENNDHKNFLSVLLARKPRTKGIALQSYDTQQSFLAKDGMRKALMTNTAAKYRRDIL